MTSANQEVMSRDARLLKTAYPEVKKIYKGTEFGNSDSDACEVLTSAWSVLRVSKPNAQLTLVDLTTASESYGGLHITSVPSGARIYVDDGLWNDLTDAKAVSHAGLRTVRLSMEGYDDAVGQVVIGQGKWAEFHRELKKK
jgi:hypothetical protein